VVFKKMLRKFGVGGPTVDTVLTNPNTRPGLALEGRVEIVGGDHAVDLEHVALGLVTRVEMESGDLERDATVEFHRLPVAGAFRLDAGERRSLPFSLPVPWETPITDVYGQRLHGMTMGVRTELAVARAVDKGDLDLINVHPLPAQERILDAFARLGFRFKHADLERGMIRGVRQTLPFYQEIEFYPPQQYAGRITEVELTFVASPHGVEVILEFDKRGGLFTGGHDAFGQFTVDHASVESTDWAAVVDGWMRQASERYGTFLSSRGGYPGGHGGYPGAHGAYHGHRRHRGGGFGAGGMVAGVAGGMIGGMLLGEAMEEGFEAFDGGGE
jgi:sporulation-control protein